MPYTDFLFAVSTMKYPNAFLLTEDNSDFGNIFFDRTGIITIDYSSDVRNISLYKVNTIALSKIQESLF